MFSIRLFAGVFLVFSCFACTHIEPSIAYGIQRNYRSFVPARIAVLGCREWPRGGSYFKQPLTTLNDDGMALLCQKFNQFVIGGFSGQAFMRGLAPGAVEQYLKKAGKSDMLGAVNGLWHHRDPDCPTCDDPAEYYAKAIAPRKEWQKWLGDFSHAVSSSDAVLMPMITYAFQGENDDRGVHEYIRRAGIVMLLVDSTSGELIWSGGRQAQAVHRALGVAIPPGGGGAKASYPEWDVAYERLFLEDVWREFPGRQYF